MPLTSAGPISYDTYLEVPTYVLHSLPLVFLYSHLCLLFWRPVGHKNVSAARYLVRIRVFIT